MTTTIVINSASRVQGSSTNFKTVSDGSFDFKSRVPGNRANKLVLRYVSIPDLFANIVENRNDHIDVIENEKFSYTIQIPAGYYTLTQLLSVITTLLTTNSILSNIYTSSIKAQTGRLSITASISDFRLLFKTGPNSHRSPWRLLGFISPISGPLEPRDSGPLETVSNVSTSHSPPNLYDPSSINIRIFLDESGEQNIFDWSSKSWSTFTIPRMTQHGQMLVYRDQPGREQSIRLDDRRQIVLGIRVQITEPDGSLMDLRGADWQLALDVI